MDIYKQRQKLVDDFIERINPYETPQPLHFDLRGYAKYLKENNLSGKDTADYILKKFSKWYIWGKYHVSEKLKGINGNKVKRSCVNMQLLF